MSAIPSVFQQLGYQSFKTTIRLTLEGLEAHNDLPQAPSVQLALAIGDHRGESRHFEWNLNKIEPQELEIKDVILYAQKASLRRSVDTLGHGGTEYLPKLAQVMISPYEKSLASFDVCQYLAPSPSFEESPLDLTKTTHLVQLNGGISMKAKFEVVSSEAVEELDTLEEYKGSSTLVSQASNAGGAGTTVDFSDILSYELLLQREIQEKNDFKTRYNKLLQANQGIVTFNSQARGETVPVANVNNDPADIKSDNYLTANNRLAIRNIQVISPIKSAADMHLRSETSELIQLRGSPRHEETDLNQYLRSEESVHLPMPDDYEKINTQITYLVDLLQMKGQACEELVADNTRLRQTNSTQANELQFVYGKLKASQSSGGSLAELTPIEVKFKLNEISNAMEQAAQDYGFELKIPRNGPRSGPNDDILIKLENLKFFMQGLSVHFDQANARAAKMKKEISYMMGLVEKSTNHYSSSEISDLLARVQGEYEQVLADYQQTQRYHKAVEDHQDMPIGRIPQHQRVSELSAYSPKKDMIFRENSEIVEAKQLLDGAAAVFEKLHKTIVEQTHTLEESLHTQEELKASGGGVLNKPFADTPKMIGLKPKKKDIVIKSVNFEVESNEYRSKLPEDEVIGQSDEKDSIANYRTENYVTHLPVVDNTSLARIRKKHVELENDLVYLYELHDRNLEKQKKIQATRQELEGEILTALANLTKAGEKIKNHEYHATLKLTGDETLRHVIAEEPEVYFNGDLAGKKSIISGSRVGEEDSQQDIDNIFGVAPSAGVQALDSSKLSQQTSATPFFFGDGQLSVNSSVAALPRKPSHYLNSESKRGNSSALVMQSKPGHLKKGSVSLASVPKTQISLVQKPKLMSGVRKQFDESQRSSKSIKKLMNEDRNKLFQTVQAPNKNSTEGDDQDVEEVEEF